MIAGRVLVQRIRSAKIPINLRPFDEALAGLCLNLSEAAYRFLPDKEGSGSEMDFVFEGAIHEEESPEELLDLLGAADTPSASGAQRRLFVFDGRFVKVLGYRVGSVVLVAIRGTASISDLIVDADIRTTKLTLLSALTAAEMHWQVHRGFLNLSLEIMEPIERELASICLPGDRIVVTGHSLGGVLGLLFAARFDSAGIKGGVRTDLPSPDAIKLDALRTTVLYSFGAPRPGKRISGVSFPHHRLVAQGDWVPRLSPGHSHDVREILLRDSVPGSSFPWRDRLDPIRRHRVQNYHRLLFR
jgi:hypothetical protein